LHTINSANSPHLTPTIRTSVLTYGALQMQTTYLLTYLPLSFDHKDNSAVKKTAFHIHSTKKLCKNLLTIKESRKYVKHLTIQ